VGAPAPQLARFSLKVFLFDKLEIQHGRTICRRRKISVGNTSILHKIQPFGEPRNAFLTSNAFLTCSLYTRGRSSRNRGRSSKYNIFYNGNLSLIGFGICARGRSSKTGGRASR
jgi:hypothetical protein